MTAAATRPTPRMREAAIWYTRHGMRVLALSPELKTPATAHGVLDATIDSDAIGVMWEDPTRNVAVATGAPSGIVVLDVDGDAGSATLAALERIHGTLPATPRVRTGRVFHLYFRHPGKPVRNRAGKLGPGLDVRGDGGYVVAPPSIHPDGSIYSWADGRRLGRVRLAPLPVWLVKLLTTEPEAPRAPVVLHDVGSYTPYVRGALECECAEVAAASKGTRNQRLNAAAFSLGQLAAGGCLDEGTARAGLLAAADTCGLPAFEARKTIDSGLAAGSKQPRAPEPRSQRTLTRNDSRHEPDAVAVAPSETESVRAPLAEQPILVNLATVAPTAVQWLWPEHIPGGKLTVIDGDPGLGKSLVTLDLAARVSTGAPMPDGTNSAYEGPGGVVLLSTEDDLADTLGGRKRRSAQPARRLA